MWWIITIIKSKWLMTKWPKKGITIKLCETKCWAKLLQSSKYSQHAMFKPWKTSWYTVNELYSGFAMFLPISSVWKVLTATVFKLVCIKSNGSLMKMQIAGPSLRACHSLHLGKSQELTFLTNSQVILMLQSRNHTLKTPGPGLPR